VKAVTDPADYSWRSPPTPTVHALKQNKRPIGFAPWPEPEDEPSEIEEPKKSKKRKKKR
jgi:hypothetical protein